MAHPRKKVVGLIRVSTSEQAADDRGGIPRQRRVIEQTVAAKNLDCVEVFEIADVSGTQVLQNPTIQHILHAVGSRAIDGLVVADLDRLFRPDQPTDYAILQVFKDTGAIIYSGDTEYNLGNKDGMLFSGIRATIAGYELALMKERAQGAKEAKRRAGKCPTNHLTLPLGVSYLRSEERYFYNEKAAVVVELFRLFDEEGIQNFCELERLTGIGHRTIKNLLGNPIYTGWRIFNFKRGAKRVSASGKTYRVKVSRAEDEVITTKVMEGCVSQERFDRVQEKLKQTTFNHVESREKYQTVNLLAGVGRCGYCGERLYCTSGRRVQGGRCSQYICKRNYYLYTNRYPERCKQPNLKQRETDELMDAFTKHVLRDPDVLVALIESSLKRISETVCAFPASASAGANGGAFQKREKRLLDAYETGLITIDVLRERQQALAKERQFLESRQPQGAAEKWSLEDFARKVVRGAYRYGRLVDVHEKKEFITVLFSEVYLKGDGIASFRLRENFLGSTNGNSNSVVELPAPFRLSNPDDEIPEGQRRCSSCKEVKAEREFLRRRGQCHPCRKSKDRERYLRR
ncbi:MAG: recombinase family protein [Chthoniobacteraceae bacterium]